jgi:hypothetical protein
MAVDELGMAYREPHRTCNGCGENFTSRSAMEEHYAYRPCAPGEYIRPRTCLNPADVASLRRGKGNWWAWNDARTTTATRADIAACNAAAGNVGWREPKPFDPVEWEEFWESIKR